MCVIALAPERVARQGLGDGGRQFLRAVVVEEREQLGGVRAERFPAPGQAFEQGRADGHGDAEPIASARGIGLTRDDEQALKVREVLNGVPGVVAARVPRNLVGAGDQSDRRRAREQREGPPDVRVRNGISISVEAHIRRLARHDWAPHVGVKGMDGQRQEARLLLREDLGDGLIALVGMWALMRDIVAPAAKLRVQVVDIGKRPRRKERITEVLNLVLDLAFFIGSSGRARPRGKMIMPSELEQARMKPNGTPLTFEDRTPKVVVVLCPSALCGGHRRRSTGR